MRQSFFPQRFGAAMVSVFIACASGSPQAEPPEVEVVGPETASVLHSAITLDAGRMLFSSHRPAAADTTFHSGAYLPTPVVRVLFVGNSFTSRNELPRLVAQLASAHDPPRQLEVHMVARDGMTLERHWQEGEVARRLAAEQWDVVVLQEQGSRPLTDPALMESYARRFAALARERGAAVVLFETWARVDEPETQKRRAAAYRRVARAVGATVAPVATAWILARAEQPGIRLHADDGLHASLAGSRLAAVVMLDTILRLVSPPRPR